MLHYDGTPITARFITEAIADRMSGANVSPIKRGKVLSAADVAERGFARYKDIDGDGIPYRTLPGNEHPLAAYFARGTGHNDNAVYSERPDDWRNSRRNDSSTCVR